MGDVITSIGSGKTYADPTAWEAASYGATGADDAIGQVYGTVTDNALLDDTTPLSVILEGEPAGQHTGQPNTGAKLTSTVSDEIVDVSGVNNVTVRRLEFDQGGGNVLPGAVRFRSAAIGGECYGNLMYGKSANRGSTCSLIQIDGATTAAKVHDNFLFDAVNSGVGGLSMMWFLNGGVTECYNNTVSNADVTDASATCYGLELNDDADHTYNNNLITDITASGGGSKGCFSDSSPTNAAANHNLDDDNTAPGANSVHNATIAFEGASDYHLAAGDTDAINAGIGPSSDANVPATDIDGDARAGATCDIGADERPEASSAKPMMYYQQMAGAA